VARNFNGGTDQIHWYENAQTGSILSETVSFWMRTTQSTTNVALWSNWNSSSRGGLGVLLSSGKVTAVGYDSSTDRFVTTSTSTVNGGGWQHVCATADRANGGRNDLYINGVSEANANSSAAWQVFLSYYTIIGDNADGFWSSYVGDMAEVAHWADVKLSADEVTALAKGFSPKRIRPSALDLYAPLVRDVTNGITPTMPTPTGVSSTVGTTVTDHPRVYG
jgi:hypothetical protein